MIYSDPRWPAQTDRSMTERLPDRTARETECRPGILSDTVMRAVVVLEAGGVLGKVSDRRCDGVFSPRAIFNILDEPACLVPETPASYRRRTSR